MVTDFRHGILVYPADDEVGYNFDEFLTSSEGQHGEVVDHGVMINEKEVLDEKCSDRD